MKLGPITSVCMVLMSCCSCADGAPAEPTRAERIERTRELLQPVLFDEVARQQAERYVDMCESDHETMFIEAHKAIDPYGPERFDTLDEAHATSGGIVLDLAAAACTSADLDRVRAFAYI